MKMEPGRPASPAGGPGPDPEPGGPDGPGAAPTPADPAPRPGLCPQDAAAGLSAWGAPGASCLLPDQSAYPDSEPDPDPDRQLPELGPLFPWTEEAEDYGSPSCPESPSLHAQDFSHSLHRRSEVDFFPSFPSPTVGELTLEVGPGDADRPSDLSQNCPFTSEPAGCPEDGPRLRAVFDALDGDGDGFVRIEDFVQFATVYGAEQVTRRAHPSPQRGRLALRASPGPTRPAVFGECTVRTSYPASSFYLFTSTLTSG